MKKMFKRFLSVLLSAAMALTMLGHPVLSIAADGYMQRNVASEESCIYECDGIIISFSANGKWDEGYSASVKLRNTTPDRIDDWYLEMVSGDDISNIWNARVLKKEDNRVTFVNDGWNQDIEPDAEIEFGFSVNNAFSGFPEFRMMPSNETGIANERYSFNYAVTDEWTEGFNGRIEIYNNSDEVIKEWQLSFEYNNDIQNIWNAEIISRTDNVYVVRGKDYNQNIGSHGKIEIGFTVLGGASKDEAKCVSLSERSLGTYDFSKIPFSKEDYYKDNDGDGVPNILEYFFGLDYENRDSNNNGSNDFDSFIVFLRWALSDDSDGDGISDFSEYFYGLDPKKPSTLDDGINDADRRLTVTLQGTESDINEIRPYVTLSTEGKYLDSFRVTKIEDNLLLNETIPGYFCNAYDLSIDDDIDRALLSFAIPESVLNNLDFVPTIYYFNEEIQELEEVSGQYRDGNKICAELTHFSKYMLLNKRMLDKNRYPVEIVAPSENIYGNTALGLVFSLDESGSLSPSNFRTMKNAASSLVNELNEDDSVSVYTFDGTIRKHCSFTDKEDALQVINNLTQHGGMTAIKDATLAAIDEFVNNSPEDVTKILILLTDGYSNYDQTRLNYEQLAQKASENNIIIYTIGVGSVNRTALETLAAETEGQYYGIADFMKLSQIFKQILVDAEVFFDSDNDGISDYHEKKIAQNQMRLSSGAEIPGYKHIDYLNPDSDGDLLEDGQEMKIVTTERGVFVRLNSSPFLPDTDNDGFDDYAEDLMGTSSFDENAPGFHEYNISEMSLGAQGRQKSYQSGGGSGGGVYGYKGTGTVMSNNPLLLTPISFKDWFKMAMEEYFWSYIHRQVQEHIYDNNANLQIEYVIPATQKKCDVVNLPKTMIWEVKPVSYYFDSLKNEEGKKQLENYVNLMNNVKKTFKAGDSSLKSYQFETRDKNYIVSYVNAGDGMIYYSFQKKEEEKPKPGDGIAIGQDNGDNSNDDDNNRPILHFPISQKDNDNIAAMLRRMRERDVPTIVVDYPTESIIIDVGALLFLCGNDVIPILGQADDALAIKKVYDILRKCGVLYELVLP